jgi:C4-dicarboxylate-specific signal transduction histidine kinase
VQQVLVNLVVNAQQALELVPAPRQLWLQTFVQNGMVSIVVADNGPGVPVALRGQIFEPFFTTKSVGKGTGLGLSQIFGFAHQSGGEVGIDSQVGKGTTVSSYLPRTDAKASNVRAHPAMQARTEEDLTVPGAHPARRR